MYFSVNRNATQNWSSSRRVAEVVEADVLGGYQELLVGQRDLERPHERIHGEGEDEEERGAT